jgi:Rps23 Pro-64 3,4-dihydroxylase Tpa1-like proline 4-hydroxylase
MELQQQQVTAVRRMTDRVSEDLNKIMEPQFDRMNQTITDFGNMATRNQTEALNQVVNEFVREMNRSLGGTFLQLNESFNKAYASQQKNEQLLGGIQQRAEMNQQVLYQEQEKLLRGLEPDYGPYYKWERVKANLEGYKR